MVPPMVPARCWARKTQDVRHVDHDGRVHVRDVVAGMKAVIYRRATSNSVESSGTRVWLA
jgi:hypothetical protein